MPNNKCKVLVVDDEPNNLQLMRQVLQDKYELAFATDGMKAIEIARKIQPDIILLDVMMPGSDGFETCSRLKIDPLTAKIPVIFVTAMGDIDDEHRGFEVGGADYITKPVSAPIVQARVRNHLALYDQSRMLEKMVEARTNQLSQAINKLERYSLDAIYRLTRAAEYKDEDTGAHVQRMSRYSEAVARQMGLSEDETKNVLYAAPLHDVGKIGVPDKILLKPGKLNEQELVIMKSHTIFGGKILEGSESDYLKLGRIIALTHHEKWDGSGYPNGLKGNDIPQIGQIIAIADVFDALTSKRPYKQAYSIEKALVIIKKGRGVHFDPDVVDAFFACKQEIVAIKEEYRDNDVSLLVKLTETKHSL